MDQDWYAGGDDEHLAAATSAGTPSPAVLQVIRALNLLAWGLESAPQPWSVTFPNDFAALVCFTRAFRQIRAASLLCHFGYYTEVGAVLRGVYEAAGLGRLLAKEPERAERWLRDGTWFPDREVRAWLIEFRSDQKAASPYASFYKQLSQIAHPVAKSCLPLVDFEVAVPRMMLQTRFDQEAFDLHLREIAATALFTCFAFRNASVDEERLPPNWRQELYELAEEVSGRDLPHLAREWDREDARFRALVERIRRANELDEALDAEPSSWRNVRDEPASEDESE